MNPLLWRSTCMKFSLHHLNVSLFTTTNYIYSLLYLIILYLWRQIGTWGQEDGLRITKVPKPTKSPIVRTNFTPSGKKEYIVSSILVRRPKPFILFIIMLLHCCGVMWLKLSVRISHFLSERISHFLS